MDKRITQAKKMLRFTDKRIEVISIDCGFDDANYFTRVFKKVEGSSPSEYRKLWKQSVEISNIEAQVLGVYSDAHSTP